MRSLVSAAVLALALTACGGDETGGEAVEEEPADISTVESCAPDNEDVIFRTTDDSVAMAIYTGTVETELDGATAIACVVSKLDGPSTLADRVSRTRGIDGTQSDDWDGFSANWSYSGSSGVLNFTVDAD